MLGVFILCYKSCKVVTLTLSETDIDIQMTQPPTTYTTFLFQLLHIPTTALGGVWKIAEIWTHQLYVMASHRGKLVFIYFFIYVFIGFEDKIHGQ